MRLIPIETYQSETQVDDFTSTTTGMPVISTTIGVPIEINSQPSTTNEIHGHDFRSSTIGTPIEINSQHSTTEPNSVSMTHMYTETENMMLGGGSAGIVSLILVLCCFFAKRRRTRTRRYCIENGVELVDFADNTITPSLPPATDLIGLVPIPPPLPPPLTPLCASLPDAPSENNPQRNSLNKEQLLVQKLLGEKLSIIYGRQT